MTSPEDKKLIGAFVANKPMFEAVRRVLLQGMIGENFEKENWVFASDRTQSDEALGKEIKLKTSALEWIDKAFNDLRKLGAPDNPHTSPANQAR